MLIILYYFRRNIKKVIHKRIEKQLELLYFQIKELITIIKFNPNSNHLFVYQNYLRKIDK
jgi:hypothetical protein